MSALLPSLGRLAVRTDPVSNFPSQDRSWEIRRPSASALANVASHAYALSPVAAHAWELALAAAHSCSLTPGLVGAGSGVCQPEDYWLDYTYFTFP